MDYELLSMSGYVSVAEWSNLYLSVWNDVSCSVVHSNCVVLRRSRVNGSALFAYGLMNF